MKMEDARAPRKRVRMREIGGGGVGVGVGGWMRTEATGDCMDSDLLCGQQLVVRLRRWCGRWTIAAIVWAGDCFVLLRRRIVRIQEGIPGEVLRRNTGGAGSRSFKGQKFQL